MGEKVRKTMAMFRAFVVPGVVAEDKVLKCRTANPIVVACDGLRFNAYPIRGDTK